MKDKEAKGAFLCPGGLKRWIRARAERSLDGSTISSIGSFVNTRKCQRSKRSFVAYGMISYGLRYIFAYGIKVTSWRLRDEQLPSGYAWLEQQTPPVNSWSLLQNKEQRTWGWYALLRGKFPIYCAIYCVGMIFSICFCVLFNVQAVLHIIALEQMQLLTQRAAEKALQSLRTTLRMNHE